MPCDYDQLPHGGIRDLIPYVPGKSSDELAQERGFTDIIKLASNENPLGCSSLVTDSLANLTKNKIANYPMSIHHPLRQKLAVLSGVNSEMITLGNGSDALFGLLITCFALHNNKHILTHDYAFSSYAIQAKTLGVPVVCSAVKSDFSVDIDAMISACNHNTALIFIANPNNPTGLLIKMSEIERLLKNISDSTLLILDEAYFEYSQELSNSGSMNAETKTAIDLLKKHPNLVITRTFSKAYGLAGLRLGYAIATPKITALLYRIQLPFVTNIAALTAAFAALDDQEFIKKTIQLNNKGLKQMRHEISALGLLPLPSSGNFITFDCKTDSRSIYQHLLNHGIIVRPLYPYGLNTYLRLTIGTEDQNRHFIDKFKVIL